MPLPSKQGNKYRVTARIKELVPNEQWWYLACSKCKRTTRAYGDSYKCYDPMCTGTGAIPRYITVIFVSHITSNVCAIETVLSRQNTVTT